MATAQRAARGRDRRKVADSNPDAAIERISGVAVRTVPFHTSVRNLLRHGEPGDVLQHNLNTVVGMLGKVSGVARAQIRPALVVTVHTQFHSFDRSAAARAFWKSLRRREREIRSAFFNCDITFEYYKGASRLNTREVSRASMVRPPSSRRTRVAG